MAENRGHPRGCLWAHLFRPVQGRLGSCTEPNFLSHTVEEGRKAATAMGRVLMACSVPTSTALPFPIPSLTPAYEAFPSSNDQNPKRNSFFPTWELKRVNAAC